MYRQTGKVDAVISVVGSVHFGPLPEKSGEQFMFGISRKLLSQVNLVLEVSRNRHPDHFYGHRHVSNEAVGLAYCKAVEGCLNGQIFIVEQWRTQLLLTDKTILVTGAGRGIGREIVITALREGAKVIAHTGRKQGERAGSGLFQSGDVLQLNGDLSVTGDIDSLWADAIAWRGRVDVLVNNAGIYNASPLEPVPDWEPGWKSNLVVNHEAPARFCRHAIQHFDTSGEGIIINMASRSSHQGDDVDHLAYGAAKGGLLALTRGIARGFAARGTLAYAVAPAWVRTEMAEQHIATVGEDKINAALPMGEVTPPGDVAETVIFLASGRARHATGCTIDITGADYVR